MKIKGLILLTALLIPVAGIAKDEKKDDKGASAVPITAYTAEVLTFRATTGTVLAVFNDLTKPYLLYSAEVRLVGREGDCEVGFQLDTSGGYTPLATALWSDDGDASPLRLDFSEPVVIPESYTVAMLVHPKTPGASCTVALNAIAAAP